MTEVELTSVTKWFEDERGRRVTRDGARPTLDAVSLSVDEGELLVVVGPSGCGKSTTLRIVAGLEHADEGTVRIGGRDMSGVAPQERDVAMVFQGYALYPQMTVAENMAFPLRMRKVDESERRRRVDEAAEMLRLRPLLARLPRELSGGERQRVAMGRAIVRRPRVFLFDEPLSNLDAALRQELRGEIGRLVRALSATAIYVTHDHVEAMTLADRICVMNAGRVEMMGDPRSVYEAPATKFVGTFLGSPKMNVLEGSVVEGLATAGPFRWRLPAFGPAMVSGPVVFGVRPEDVLVRDRAEDAPESHPFDVLLAEPLGAETHLVLRAGDLELRARVPGFVPRKPGERMHVALDSARLHVFDATSGKRLE